ncbi:hypothetical protein [Yunchengibacter salinarum]|uniref:hypothetical protein n=1 Tax=Yunchengibacter salinarum TaxID=3133399 RepID=UPI0035B58BCF
MDNNTLAIYVHELRNQCLHTKISFDLFNQALSNQASAGILYGGQMALLQASLIGGLLWPTRARARKRGETLRKYMNLPEKHPLNDRRLIEVFERNDEKTEEWIAETKGKQTVFDFVGDPAAIAQEELTERNFFRAYDPQRKTYYYRGTGYNMDGIAKAVSDLSGRTFQLYRQLFPEQAKREEEAARQQQAQQQAQQAGQQTSQAPAANDPAAAAFAGDNPAAADFGAPLGAELASDPVSQDPVQPPEGAPAPVDLGGDDSAATAEATTPETAPPEAATSETAKKATAKTGAKSAAKSSGKAAGKTAAKSTGKAGAKADKS